jgi:NDP-sugar pyrophosphorylase family protein
MKAMILAAGLGTRLKPFTDAHPKALFVHQGQTLLEHAIDHLKSAGIREVIINVHHFADQIIDFLKQHAYFGMQVTISDETGELLETGGGVKKAAWFFQNCDGVIVRNVDIISDLDLLEMVIHHKSSGALATLAIRNRETTRYFLFNEEMQLCGWENRKTGEHLLVRESSPALQPKSAIEHNSDQVPLSPFAFSGIQVLNPEIFPLICEEGKFSLTSLYLRLAREEKINGYLEKNIVWQDVGRVTRDE